MSKQNFSTIKVNKELITQLKLLSVQTNQTIQSIVERYLLNGLRRDQIKDQTNKLLKRPDQTNKVK